jgi:hypothetical protein
VVDLMGLISLVDYSIIFAALGVVAGVVNSIYSSRLENKSRQIRLISELSRYTQEEFQKQEYQLFALEWDDYDDFERKYGSDFDLDQFARRYAIWSEYNKMGFLLKTGLVDVETLLGFLGGQLPLLWMWRKYESIIREQRKRYRQPDLFVWWEHAADEIERYYSLKGHADVIPESISYVADA